MAANESIISDYGNDLGLESHSSVIDFSLAQKLMASGSTCDTYLLPNYRGRKVFVKRLKDEFRYSPCHLNAFRKEYELGVGLTHSAFPNYIDLGPDYIVMNYIDGKTIADMISSDDKWIKVKNNVIKVLGQILDALQYLHNKNLIHCDIKSDNVIITHEGKNVVILDLDKAYTSWNDNTPGTTRLYEVREEDENKRTTKIDFYGIAKLAEKLADFVGSSKLSHLLASFAKACRKENTSIDELRKILENVKSGNSFWKWFAVVTIPAAILLALSILYINKETASNTQETPIISEQEVPHQESEPALPQSQIAPTQKTQEPTRNSEANVIDKSEINRTLKELFQPLDNLVKSTNRRLDSGELSDAEMRDLMFEITEKQAQVTQEAYSLFEAKYPSESLVDVQLAVSGSEAYISTTRLVADCTSRIASILNSNPD